MSLALPVLGQEAQQAPAIGLSSFWYVVALAEELRPGVVLARKVLGEHLAVFRGPDGKPAALLDRCMHRSAPLSGGRVENGTVRCPYHGWVYDHEGQVCAVPSEGCDFKKTKGRRVPTFSVMEQDGFVYVRLGEQGLAPAEPFRMPHFGEKGWKSFRLINRFENDVTNCAENFIDIPHTTFVHHGIFRTARQQKIEATVERKAGTVLVTYRNETSNLGWFSWFLNPQGHPFVHTDSFHMPNVTSVVYEFAPNRAVIITSHSVPETDRSTLVYTDLTYNFGIWTPFAKPILKYQAQAVIDQDVVALNAQGKVIERYGDRFANTSADVIHVFVESIRQELAEGRDPRLLPERSVEISFWV